MAYPDNTARCVFDFVLPNGSHGFCTPHVRSFDGTDLDTGDVEAIANLLADWAVNDNFEGQINAALMNFGPDELVLSSITVTSLKAVAPPQFQLAVNDPGNGSGTPMPNEAALVVTLLTRSGRSSVPGAQLLAHPDGVHDGEQRDAGQHHRRGHPKHVQCADPRPRG